jgi:hypothetical protein
MEGSRVGRRRKGHWSSEGRKHQQGGGKRGVTGCQAPCKCAWRTRKRKQRGTIWGQANKPTLLDRYSFGYGCTNTRGQVSHRASDSRNTPLTTT